MYTGYHSLYVVPCSSNVVVCCVMNLYAVQYISGFINEFHGEPAIVRTGLSVQLVTLPPRLESCKCSLLPLLTKMGNATTPEFNILEVAGNAPDDIKRKLGNMRRFFNYGSKKQQQLNAFGKDIQLRLKLTELSIINKAEEPNKLEGRAVLDIDVAEGK